MHSMSSGYTSEHDRAKPLDLSPEHEFENTQPRWIGKLWYSAYQIEEAILREILWTVDV